MRQKDIFPVYDKLQNREEKECFLNQHSVLLWLTGLSGAGKTTIASGLCKKLFENGFFSQIFDGDNIRDKLNYNLSFSEADRKLNIIRIAEISKLFLESGIICVNCFISPTSEMRQQAKDIIGMDDFFEIYINCPIDICEKRDKKGLYEKARLGIINDFTGINSPYEIPINPDLEIKTDILNIEESINKLYDFVLPKIKFNKK